MNNWEVIVDEKTFEIYKDEETMERCWEFYNSNQDHSGFGVIAETRDKCIKSIIKRYNEELKTLKKEVKIKSENFKILKEFLRNSDSNE